LLALSIGAPLAILSRVDIERAGVAFVRGAFALFAVWLACGCTAPPPLSPREPTPGMVHFTVKTFNIHRYKSADVPTIEAIGAGDADVVCLQEVTAAWERVIRARYGGAYANMIFAPDEEAGGLGILSRFPIEDRGVVTVPGNWHPGWVVRVETPAGPVQLLAVHLRALFEGRGDPVSSYLGSADDHEYELGLFLAKLSPELPTIVMGDFNESPKGAAVRRLESLGYENALPLFHPGQFTWQGRSVASALELSIDHILFDSRFTPLDAWVERGGGSDHLPVYARLEMEVPPLVERASVLESERHAEQIPALEVGELGRPGRAVLRAEHEAVVDADADADGDGQRPVEPPRAEPRRGVDPRLVVQP
jgi:endonuclease/exonuclease/phosphatase family metal-dependent hydrolase